MEARNAATVGWMKYTKALPVTNEMTVRRVSSAAPSRSKVEIRSCLHSRRATRTYDQARAASNAPRKPARRRTK